MNGIWIIEDHAAFRTSLTLVLAAEPDLGPSRAFATCEEMIAALDHAPPPAVMLMDLGLPGMGGLEGLALVRSRCPDTHVLVLTAFDDERKVRAAVRAGASGYLLKTADGDDIVDGIREVLGGGAPMTPSIARKVLGMISQPSDHDESTGLSEREREILRCVVDGLLKKQIALRLGLSIHTVDSYMRRMYEKLEVNSRSGAVAKALRDGLV